MAEKVYILILNWNNWKDTMACIESVFRSSYESFQAVVVDNGSEDGSEESIRGWAESKRIPYARYDRDTADKGGDPVEEKKLYPALPPPVQHPMIIIQTGGNLGYAGGNNVGLRYAMARGDYRYIWLLNNDTVVDGDALAEMVKLAGADERTGMVGSKLIYLHRPDVLHMAGGVRIIPWAGNTSMIAGGMKDDGRWERLLELDYVGGASVLVKREVLDVVGLMDERYFLYWEDADWGLRARREGYRLLYCPQSRVWHREGGTAGRLSALTDYYWVRNGLMFTRKFYPWLLPLVTASYLCKYTLVRTIKGQPHNLGAFVRGARDFLRRRSGRMQ